MTTTKTLAVRLPRGAWDQLRDVAAEQGVDVKDLLAFLIEHFAEHAARIGIEGGYLHRGDQR